MQCTKGILLVFFITIFQSYLFSQSFTNGVYRRLPAKTINYEQGLLNNSTTDIITDIFGFTWVSTKTGMQRYNGYVLETINPIVNNETININYPVHFFSLQNGFIWISYKKGILEYNPQNNVFKKIISVTNPSNLNFSILPAKETSEGIWCLQKEKGLVIYSPSGVFIKTIPASSHSFVENVFSQQGNINKTTFATNQNSIFLYNGKDLIQQINFKTPNVNYIGVTGIDGFVCSNSRLFTVSDKEITGINLSDKKIEKNILLDQFFKEDVSSTSIFLSDNSRIYVALKNRLFELDTLLNNKKEFTNLNREPLLLQGYISKIYADPFKRIWLLTNDDIKRLQDVVFPFRHFIYPNSENNFIRCMYFDKQNHLLLAGCYNGGLQLYDTLGNALWPKAIISENVKDINTIEKLNNDHYLIVTFGKGWYILNLPQKQIKPIVLNDKIKHEVDPRNNNFMSNLQRINDSTVYIATSANIYSCVFKNERLKSVQKILPSEKLLPVQINCFINASNKSMWVGCAAGVIYKLDTNNSFQTIHLPGNYDVRSFAEDAQRHIWIGTDKGLYIYSPEGILIKAITILSGLLNDCIYAMLPVKNQPAVFASSNLGLSYIPLNGSIVNYTKSSGLQDNEFNTESATMSASGEFYFGGIKGITAFYPPSLSVIKDSPVINITWLSINDVDYHFSAGIWRNDSIILNYDQNHLGFDIAALGLLNPNEYAYHYRIKGFEQNYQATNQPTGIKYVLPPGKYLLQVNCSPIFSSQSVFKKTFVIIISPPWWQTSWFRVLMVVLCIVSVAFIVRQYLHYHYQKKLKALQLKQEIQEERERISRDLHDNLGAYAAAIASNLANFKNEENTDNQTILKQLKINSQSIISQLSATIWALNKEAISLTSVSDRFKVFIQKIQPNHPGINISIEENISNDQVLSPANALHLLRIMQEGVNNALKHSGGNCIKILIDSEKKWSVRISDNGKGFEEGVVREDRNGLKNMKMRTGQSGWYIHWQKNIPSGTSVVISSTTN